MLKTFETLYNYGNDPIKNVGELRYNVCIVSYEKFEGCQRNVIRIFEGLRFELMMKYQWYFRRIAALHQIEYPKQVIGFEISRYESAQAKKLYDKKLLSNKIKAAKSKITQLNNELDSLRKGWMEIFAIEEHPKWAATSKKMIEKHTQLAMMERQLADME